MGRTRTIDDESLLRAAGRLFRERGHTVSTREIARDAGISEAVLYQRFGSKDDLFFAAMTPPPTDVDALLGPVDAVATPAAARAYLDEAAARVADLLGEMMPTLLQVLAYPATDHRKLVDWHRALPFEPLLYGLAARFAELTARGAVAVARPEAAAQVFVAAIHSAVLVGRMTAGGSHGTAPLRADRLRDLVETLWTGLAVPTAPRAPR